MTDKPAKRSHRRTHLQHWRKHRKLTQDQLAARIDVASSYISMLERGERGYTQETMEALADALDTDVASLIGKRPDDVNPVARAWENASKADREKIAAVVNVIIGKTGT